MGKKKKVKRLLLDAVILDTISEGVLCVDAEWRVTAFNKAAEKITGVPRAKAVGRPCWDVLRASICEGRCALAQTMKTGKPVSGKAIYLRTNRGRRVPVSLSTTLVRSKSGKVVGGVETFRDLTVVEALRGELDARRRLDDLVGQSRPMRALFDLLPQVSRTDSPLLLTGERGTGKRLVARVVHGLSPRQEAPFVVADTTALPEALVEAELFGHAKGAFPGARADMPGRIGLADGGSVFVEEVADLPARVQAKLVRLLRDGTYEPVGAKRSRKVDCRILCATSADLDERVRAGDFLESLLEQIGLFRLPLAPLRERRDDVPLLARHFLTRLESIHAKGVDAISPEVLRRLLDHAMPGNVGQLEKAIEHAYVLCTGATLLAEHLPSELRPSTPSPPLPAASLNELEGRFLLRALERNGWNRCATAKDLGMHPSTLWRKLKRCGVPFPTRDGRHKE